MEILTTTGIAMAPDPSSIGETVGRVLAEQGLMPAPA